MTDHLDFIMAWEAGEIESEADLVAGFQSMIDDGTVWQLQGCYGRMADQLITAGYCQPPTQQREEAHGEWTV